MDHTKTGTFYPSYPGGITISTFDSGDEGGLFEGYFCYRCRRRVADTKEDLWVWLKAHNMLSDKWNEKWEDEESNVPIQETKHRPNS